MGHPRDPMTPRAIGGYRCVCGAPTTLALCDDEHTRDGVVIRVRVPFNQCTRPCGNGGHYTYDQSLAYSAEYRRQFALHGVEIPPPTHRPRTTTPQAPTTETGK